MLWFLTAYFGCVLAATIVYVRLPRRLEVPPDLDPEAEWWRVFEQARRQLGHNPRHAEVLDLLQKAAAERRAA
jgi:hypothetical protein